MRDWVRVRDWVRDWVRVRVRIIDRTVPWRDLPIRVRVGVGVSYHQLV